MSIARRILILGSLILAAAAHLPAAQGSPEPYEPLVLQAVEAETHALAWHPTELLLAVATDAGVQLFDADLQLLESLAPLESFSSVDWSSDGSQLAAGGNLEPRVTVWSYTQGDFVPEAQPVVEGTSILNVAWNNDDSQLAALAFIGLEFLASPEPRGNVYLLDTTTWASLALQDRVAAFDSPTRILEWNPQADQFLVAGSGFSGVLDVSSNSLIWSIPNSFALLDSDWSSADQIASIYTESDVDIAVVDADRGTLISILEIPGERVARRLEWSPDAQFLFVSEIGIIHPSTGTTVRTFTEQNADWGLSWHSVGELIAVASYDNTLYLLDGGNLAVPAQEPTLTPRPTRTATPGPIPTATPAS
jgi:WD40 repeat protein